MSGVVLKQLESEDVVQQATALLQVLNALAGAKEVSAAVTATCRVVIQGSAPPPCKKLGYDVVRTATLSDSDWDLVLEALKADLAPNISSPEVQAAAFEVLPLIPAHKLTTLLVEQHLAERLPQTLTAGAPEVRAAAVRVLGSWLASRDVLGLLVGMRALADAVDEWVEALGDTLLDPSNPAAAAAHAAVGGILSAPAEEWSGPAVTLWQKAGAALARAVLAALAPVLRRAEQLPPGDAAHPAAALLAVLRYATLHSSWQPLSATHEKAVGMGDPPAAWVHEQVASFFLPLLSSVEPAVVLEAAKGLLGLARLVGRGPGTASIGPSAGCASTWAPLAVSALIDLWGIERLAQARSQIMELLSRNLCTLQPLGQVQLIKQLMPMVAALPAAGERVGALAAAWRAGLDVDLATRRASRAGDRLVPGVELKALLTDSFVLETISDSGSRQNPAFKEELVAALLETVSRHPRAAGPLPPPPFPAAAPGGGPRAGDGGGDLEAITRLAARAQRIAELADWLGAAKIALQGTKACLGWDRDPVGGTYACTAVVDAWLALLQRAFVVARALPRNARPPSGRRTTFGSAVVGLDAPGDRVSFLTASYYATLQDLLLQLLIHWKVLSPAIQARALWVAAHHLDLASSLDPTWGFLLQALAAAISGQEDAIRSRKKQSGRAAAAAGRLAAPRSANPFAADGGAEALEATVDEGDIRGEAAGVGLVVAERLSALLAANARDGAPLGLKELAAKLAGVLQPYTAAAKGGPEAADRCARCMLLLQAVAEAPAPPPPETAAPVAGEATDAEGEASDAGNGDPATPGPTPAALVTGPGGAVANGALPGVGDGLLVVPPEMRVTARCPLGPPGGSVLHETLRVTRYLHMGRQLAAAINPPGPAEVTDNAEGTAAPGILEVMALASDAGRGVTELTGPSDPLRITASHTLENPGRTLTLLFEATNRLTGEMKGAVVRLAVSGPVIADVRGPMQFRFGVLGPGDSASFRAVLRITSFGRVSAQPLVTLPARAAVLPGDDPSLRCSAYTVPPIALLSPPLRVPEPNAFFQMWGALPGAVEMAGVCNQGGVGGGLALLSALERGPLRCAHHLSLPAQGGFQAAYLGMAWGGDTLALLVSAQLLPTGPVLFSAAPGRVVCRVALRTSSADVVAAIQSDQAAFAREIFGDTLAVGLNPDAVPPPPAGGSQGLHPSIAPMRRYYALPTAAGSPTENGRGDELAVGGRPDDEGGEPIAFDAAVIAEWRQLAALSLEA